MKSIYYKYLAFFINIFLIIFLLAQPIYSNTFQENYNQKFVKIQDITIPFIKNTGFIDNSSILYFAKTFSGTIQILENGQIYLVNQKQDLFIKQSLVNSFNILPYSNDISKTQINYFKNNFYKTNTASYNSINFDNIYPGVSMKIKAYANTIEKIFYVKPEQSYENIKIALTGENNCTIEDLIINESSQLEILTKSGSIKLSAPVAYQIIDGKRKNINISYKLFKSDLCYGFFIEEYDHTKELIIDPLLSSTFYGGTANDDIYDIKSDSLGNIFVAGSTFSSNFPAQGQNNGYDMTFSNSCDAFVSKFDSDLKNLLVTTFIGGSDLDEAIKIAIDKSDNIYVAGQTSSTNFPMTDSNTPAYNTNSGGIDAFVVKFNNNLNSFEASTYLGGGYIEKVASIMLNYSGNTVNSVFVSGYTDSPNFKFPPNIPSYDIHANGYEDVFVVKFDANLSQLQASTLLGGDKTDKPVGMSLDSSGNVIIAGQTKSTLFPKAGSFNSSYSGNIDVFISKLKNDLSTLIYSRLLGGQSTDKVYAIVKDKNENIFITGSTSSSDFPVSSGSEIYDNTINGTDVFITKFNSNFEMLESTFIGGSQWEYAYAIAADYTGSIYIAGETFSDDFPTTPGAYDQHFKEGDRDGFVCKFDSNLSKLAASTFTGGKEYDQVKALTIGINGNVYLAGLTNSSDFQTIPGNYITNAPGAMDIFISKITPDLGGNLFILEGESITVTMSEDGMDEYNQIDDFKLTLHVKEYGAKDVSWFLKDGIPAHGTAFVSGTGNEKAITYTPDHNYNGNDSFIVHVGSEQLPDNSFEQLDSILVNVVIKPSPDPPTFPSQNQYLTINENCLAGTIVGKVIAFDVDNDTLEYSIVSGDNNKIFNIIPNSGEIKVSNNNTLIDYETHHYFDLTVSVTDNLYTRTVNVVININDINDAPEINSKEFHIKENSPKGTVVETISAEDPEGYSLTYSIVEGNENTSFEIDPLTGQLSVYYPGSLDFETFKRFNLLIAVSDSELTSNKSVTIIIDDVNEKPVILNQTCYFNENSGNDKTYQIKANDPEGESLKYALVDGNLNNTFFINTFNGVLSIQDPEQLDYETNPGYTLTVSAGDGIYTTTAIVNIDLININDNIPQADSQSFTVNENVAGGTYVGTVEASDADPDTIFNFSILKTIPSNGFKINKETGAISVNNGVSLDCEENNFYTLTVEISDHVNKITTIVSIEIIDLNEYQPYMDFTTYIFNVNENSKKGTEVKDEETNEVKVISATDKDRNSSLIYSITSGNVNGYFYIDSKQGIIKVNNGDLIDYESMRSHFLTVQVSDGLNSDIATVIVNVNDVNDNSPIIEDQEFYVNENSSLYTFIGKVKARDPDTVGDISFRYLAGEMKEAFYFEPNGSLTVKDPSQLDYENGLTKCEWIVEVSDGISKDTAVITINVVNVNDSAPIIKNQTFYLEENKSDGTWVGTVVAYDTDPLDVLKYEIVGGNDNNSFAINQSTGKLVVNGDNKINYESITVYQITIHVSDGSNLSSAVITIIITPINDPPIVKDQVFYVDENSPAGTIVGPITYDDEDSLDICFEISSGNDGNTFKIDSKGNIIIQNSGNVNFENNTYFNITIGVSDEENKTKALMRININDLNDKPAIYDQVFYVNENKQNGEIVARISFTDEDPGDLPILTVISGNINNVFAFDKVTGEISVFDEDQLDYETIPVYHIKVQAFDGTVAKTAIITIYVNNLNENSPEVPDQTFFVNENPVNNTFVGLIKASDLDGDKLTYKIIYGNTSDIFAIPDTSYGTITVKNGTLIDYETQKSYTLTVKVSDDTYDAVATITIGITNINDNEPKIDNQSFDFNENNRIGDIVGVLESFDADSDPPEYSILYNNTESPFIIEPQNGIIKAMESLDFETISSYTLTVRVFDGKYYDSAYVFINIQNLNDNSPVLNDQSFFVNEKSEYGAWIGTIVVHDADGDTLSYTIVSGNSEDVFAIDKDTGEITVNKSGFLNDEIQNMYTLTVAVSDGIYTPTSRILINVYDEDELHVINDQSFTIMENSPKGTWVGSIIVHEMYQGGLRFTIVGGNDDSTFAIDINTGRITVDNNAKLDRELNQFFWLLVNAFDGVQTHNATITIKIKDENEFAPIFLNTPYDFSIDENTENDQTVGTVSADDNDATSEFSFSIRSGAPSNPFKIDAKTGVISVNGNDQFDYETVKQFKLIIAAQDDTYITSETVIVNINDINEYPPVITQDSINYNLSEFSNENQVLLKVEANDTDPTDIISFTIEDGNSDDIFIIDSTGTIIAKYAKRLNYEDTNAYTLTVRASDGLFNDETTVHINIIDENDSPVITLDLFARVPDIQCGASHSVALDSDGSILSWGDNSFGQLGDFTTVPVALPKYIEFPGNAVAIATSYYHVAAIREDSTVWTWGWNSRGQLGNGTTNNMLSPVQVSNIEDVVQVKTGVLHTLALKQDGSVWAWGGNSKGQLGDGTIAERLTPQKSKNIGNIISISAGFYHSMALDSEGYVWTWGKNTSGQLGDGNKIDKITPQKLVDLKYIIAIDAGEEHSIALRDDGTVWTWGSNSDGQLGIGNNISQSIPQQVPGLSDIIKIAAGSRHNLALKSDGTIMSWGINDNGQLGIGNTANQNKAQKIANFSSVVTIDAGDKTSMALKEDGTVWSWGLNTNGQLGDNTGYQSNIPIQVHDPTDEAKLNIGIAKIPNVSIDEDNATDIIEFKVFDPDNSFENLLISASSSHPTLIPVDQINLNCTEGSCWLNLTPTQNAFGKTTIRIDASDNYQSSTAFFNVTVNSVNDLPQISEIPDQTTDENTATDAIFFTIFDQETQANNLKLTGMSSDLSFVPVQNIIFSGSAANRSVTVIPASGKNGKVTISIIVDDGIDQISYSFDLLVNSQPVISDIGDISIQEDSSTGFLSFNISDNETSPENLIVQGISSNKDLVPDENIIFDCNDTACTVIVYPKKDASGSALITISVSDGSAYTTDTFTLNVQSYNDSPTVEVNLSTTTPAIAAGGYHNLALESENQVWSWGNNDSGQLGAGKNVLNASSSIPITVSGLNSIISIAAGKKHSVALSTDGRVFTWGNNNKGQLGNGTSNVSGNPEVYEIKNLNNIMSIDAGYAHTVALSNEGKIWVWGSNDDGQLGNGISGELFFQSTPLQLSNLYNIISVVCGHSHTVALSSDGRIRSWGLNSTGQLGNGTLISSNSPVNVSNLIDVLEIAAGDFHTIALKNNGTIWAWGDNPFGQLGNGVDEYSDVPVQVYNITNVSAISAGSVHSLALKNDGTVWAWGGNDFGQLGDGTNTSKFTPVQVKNLYDVIAVSAGHYHSIALKNDGTIWAWGENSYGQLGNAAYSSSNLPVQVKSSDNQGFLNIGIPYVTYEDTPTGLIDIVVNDMETNPLDLELNAISSDTRLIPNGNIEFIGTGKYRQIRITPAPDQYGMATITLVVNDGSKTSRDSFTIWVKEVNDYPFISDIGYQSTNEDTKTGNIVFTINDPEAASDQLYLSAQSSNTQLVSNENIIFGGEGEMRTVSIMPNANMNGMATIKVTVSDGSLSSSTIFTLRVKAVNDSPVISDISNQSTGEDIEISEIRFTISDAETPAENLKISASSSNEKLIPLNNITFGGSGENRTVSIMPYNNLYGESVITITLDDGILAVSDSFLVVVNSINDAPQISYIDTQRTLESMATNPISFTIFDLETPARLLAVAASSANPTLVPLKNIVFSGTDEQRTVTITPVPELFGIANITILVTDGQKSSTEIFNLIVTEMQDWMITQDIVTFTDFQSISGSSPNDIFIVGTGSTIYSYNGIKWTKMINNYDEDLNDVWATSGPVYAVGRAGTILKYDGVNWLKMDTNTDVSLNGIWGISQTLFVVGDGGLILHYDGKNWAKMNSNTIYSLNAIWGNSKNVYAAGNAGIIVKYDGQNWVELTGITPYTLRGIWGTSESDVYVVGDAGKIFHFDGTDWTEMLSPTTSSLKAIWGSSSSNIFAVGLRGTILHYDGNKWENMQSSTTYTLASIWGNTASSVFIAGENGTILERAVGTISGKLSTEITGRLTPIVGANLTIVGTEVSTISDENGNYTLTNIPLGTHQLEVISNNFETKIIDDVRVPGGKYIIPEIEINNLDTEGYSQEELEQAILLERLKFDPDGDGQINLKNFIYWLQKITKIEQ